MRPDAADLSRFWTAATLAGRVDNGVDLDDEEQGAAIWFCRGPAPPGRPSRRNSPT